MPPRLPHQGAPQGIVVIPGESAAFQHVGSLDARTAADHHAERLAPGV
jgi:hypothetical protein